MSHEEIAIGIGIDRTTLEKYYAAELSTVAYTRRLEVLTAMHKSALKGNVAAQKAYLAMDPALAAPPEPEGNSKPEAKAEPIGKKQQAQVDAVSAAEGSDWHADLPRHPTTH